MLMVCGLSRESAVAHLVPTSSHPAYPPEVWERDDKPSDKQKGQD